MNDFATKLDSAVRYLEGQKKVVFAYLFGSMAAGSPTPMSDIDIAVYLESDTGEFDCRMEIIGHLSDIFQTEDLDVVILKKAPPTLVMNILKAKEILVDKQPFIRHRFESMAFRQYFDFAPREKFMLEEKVLHG
jgi:hypothetical protein